MKFSIIMPAHNEEANIEKALQSVKHQTFTDYELIVVCDACTDRTQQIASLYTPNIHCVNYCHDGMTRNRGLDNAKGDWVLFMDADDWYLHEFVFQQLSDKIDSIDINSRDVIIFGLIWKHIGYAGPRSRQGTFYTHSVNKCWKRKSIGSERFPNVKPGSDAGFFQKMMARHINIEEWDMPLYYYNYLRKGSISDQVGRTAEKTKAYWSTH